MSSLSELSDNVDQSDFSDAPIPAPRAEQGDNNDSDAHSARSWGKAGATPLKSQKPAKTYSKKGKKSYGQNGKSPAATSAFPKDVSEEDSLPEHESAEEDVAPRRKVRNTAAAAKSKPTARAIPKQVLEAQTTPSKASTRTSKRTTSQRKREIGLSEKVPTLPTRGSELDVTEMGKRDRAGNFKNGEIPKAQAAVTRKRGRPPKVVTYAESEEEQDDGAGIQYEQHETGKKQRNGGAKDAAGNGTEENVQDEDGDLSKASELTMPPSSPAVPKARPHSAAEASSDGESASNLKETAQSGPAAARSNRAKQKKTAKKTSTITRENGNEEGCAASSSLTKIPDSEPLKGKGKATAAAIKSKETVSTKRSKANPTQKKPAKAAKPPKATTSSAASSSPRKTTKVKRNGKKAPVAQPISTQTTDGIGIEAMYLGSSQPYASGTTMLSDSESSDEDERIKVSRLFDPVKRTPQKRKGNHVEGDGAAGKSKKLKKGKMGQDDDDDNDATSAEDTAAESEVEFPKLRRDLDASNGTNVYCKNGRHGLYFVGVVTGFDDLSDLPPAKRKKHKEGLYLIKLPVEDDKIFKKRRDEFFTENDDGFATCKLGEVAPEVKEDLQQSDARTRVSTPPLPENCDEEFADLDYVVQLQAIRPHLERIIRDQYRPAQERVEKFYRKAKALEFTQWYGNVARHYIDEVFIPELTRWALRRPIGRLPSEDHDMDGTAPEQPSRPTGSARYENLSDDDRESYVSRVLLNEAIIFINRKAMKLDNVDLQTLMEMWADDDLYPEEEDVERKTELMRDLVARKELDRLALEEPDAYMSWSVLMEARNMKRLAEGLPLEGEKKPDQAIEERKGRAARSRNAVSYRE